MVERMNSQIRGLTMATKNANDGIALIRTVENALVSIRNAAANAGACGAVGERDQLGNGTRLCDNELNQLQLEISRVSANTRYNGQS